MKVSIIIPVYNQAEYLDEAIASAVNQRFSDFEVIVVNDGSTDGSLECARSWSGVKIVNQSNKGLPGARNAGVMNSSGEFLLMLDGDDWIEPDYLEKTVPRMTEGIGIVCPAAAPFGYQVTDKVWHACWPTVETIKERNLLFYSALMRRTAFLETGGYNPRLTWGYEDWNLWIDMIKRGWATVIVAEALFHYRVKASSMFTEARRHHEELLATIHALHPDLYGVA